MTLLETFRQLFYLTLIILLCSACGPTLASNRGLDSYHYTKNPIGITYKEIPLYIDYNLGEADKLAILHAIEQWNYAMNGNVALKVVSWDYRGEVSEMQRIRDNHGVIIILINSFQAHQHNRSESVIGFVNDINGWVVYLVRDRIRNEDISGITLHELGHILGALHTEGDLMAPYFDANTYQCIDRETLEQVARQQLFDIKDGNYCYPSKD